MKFVQVLGEIFFLLRRCEGNWSEFSHYSFVFFVEIIYGSKLKLIADFGLLHVMPFMTLNWFWLCQHVYITGVVIRNRYFFKCLLKVFFSVLIYHALLLVLNMNIGLEGIFGKVLKASFAEFSGKEKKKTVVQFLTKSS